MIAKLAMLAKLKENWERGYVNIFQQISTKKWVFYPSSYKSQSQFQMEWSEDIRHEFEQTVNDSYNKDWYLKYT